MALLPSPQLRRDRWARVACLALLTVVAVALARWKVAFLGDGDIARGDVFYDLAVARNVARGEGFTTNLLPLGALELALRSGFASRDPWPSLHKFLAMQVLLAPVVRLLGATIAAARVGSFVPYVATVWALFIVLARALRSARYALLSALAFIAFNDLNNLALSGLNATTDMLLFTAAIYLWFASLRRPYLAIVGGATLAVCVLDRYPAAMLVPFYLWGVYRTSGKGGALRALFGACTLLAPTVVLSLARYHLPFPSPQGHQLFLLHTKHFTTDPWYTSNVAMPPFGCDVLFDVLRKARASLMALGAAFTETVVGSIRNAVVAFLALVGSLSVLRRRQNRVIIQTVAAYGVTFIGVHLLLVIGYRYLVFLLPCIWLCASLGVRSVAEKVARRLGVHPLLVACALLAVVALPDVLVMVRGARWVRANATLCPYGSYCNRVELNDYLREHYPRRGLVIAGGDRPWDLALATDNRLLPIPERPTELARFTKAGLPLDLLLVPGEFAIYGDGARPPGWLEWDALREAKLDQVEALTLRHTFSDGSLLYAREAGGPVRPFDHCDISTRLNLHSPGHRRYLGEEFRYTERGSDQVWAWVEGSKATLTLVTCAEARDLALTLLAKGPSTYVTVRVNGQASPTGRVFVPDHWGQLRWSIPPGSAVNGTNRIELEVESGGTEPLMVALAGAELTTH